MSSPDMDPVTTQALQDLKDLLRDKVITLAEWRQEVQALRAATPVSQPPRKAPPPAPTRQAPRRPPPPAPPPPAAPPTPPPDMDEKHDSGPDETSRELARLYRLVTGRVPPAHIATAMARATTGALREALEHLELIRRGLEAYRDLKGRKGAEERAAKFRTVLKRKVAELDSKLLEKLWELERDPEELEDEPLEPLEPLEEKDEPLEDAPDEPLHWRVLRT